MGSRPTALGLIIGPIIGIKSDRYRSKWADDPFMLIPVPFATPSMLGLAFALGWGATAILYCIPRALTLGLVWFVAFDDALILPASWPTWFLAD